MNKIAKILSAILLSGLTTFAYAATTGAYLGAGLGLTQLQASDDFLYSHKQSDAKGALGGRVFAGYNFNDYLGLEAGVAHYGKTNLYGNQHNFNAVDVVAKAYLPINDTGFNLYALGGVAAVYDKVDVESGPVAQQGNKTNHKFRPKYGVGVSYDIPDTKVTANFELSRIQGDGNVKTNTSALPSANMMAINLAYNFG